MHGDLPKQKYSLFYGSVWVEKCGWILVDISDFDRPVHPMKFEFLTSMLVIGHGRSFSKDHCVMVVWLHRHSHCCMEIGIEA
jgi:hypothetical protein